MNLKTLTVLNDKLQAAIQSEKLDLIEIALDQMKDELSSIRVRAGTHAWMREYFNPLNEEFKKLEPLTKGVK